VVQARPETRPAEAATPPSSGTSDREPEPESDRVDPLFLGPSGSKPAVRRSLVPMAAGLSAVLVLVGGFFLYRHLATGSLRSEVKALLPVEEFAVEDTDLYVRVKDDWFKTTPREVKERSYALVGKALSGRNIQCAHFLNAQRAEIASVGIPSTTRRPSRSSASSCRREAGRVADAYFVVPWTAEI